MTTKGKKVGERLRAMCPECERETAHVIAGVDDDGEIDKVRCTVCSNVHALEGAEGAATDDAEVEQDEDEEAEDDEEELEEEEAAIEGEAVASTDEPFEGVAAEEGAEPAEAEADADEDEDEDSPVAAARQGVARAQDEVEAAAEEEEEEEDEDEDDDEDDDEEDATEDGFAHPPSIGGRPVYAAGLDEPVDDEEAEAAPKKKKKRAATRKKATSKSAPAKSWSPDLETLDASRVRAYSLKDTYRNDEVIRHSKFGVGRVVEVLGPQKISVIFKEGQKMMLQGQR